MADVKNTEIDVRELFENKILELCEFYHSVKSELEASCPPDAFDIAEAALGRATKRLIANNMQCAIMTHL